jgi:lysyl-tRNA synthetase class 2
MKSAKLYRKVSGSDAVVHIGYDPVAGTLEVGFDHGGTYEYYDVDIGTAAGFEVAGSKGEYFNQEIRGQYAYKRIG